MHILLLMYILRWPIFTRHAKPRRSCRCLESIVHRSGQVRLCIRLKVQDLCISLLRGRLVNGVLLRTQSSRSDAFPDCYYKQSLTFVYVCDVCCLTTRIILAQQWLSLGHCTQGFATDRWDNDRTSWILSYRIMMLILQSDHWCLWNFLRITSLSFSLSFY